MLEKPRAYYDQYDYHQFWTKRLYEDAAEKLAIERLLKRLPKHSHVVLDAGGGYGRNVPIYAPFFQKLVLLDPSPKNLGHAKDLTKDFPNLILKQGVVEKLPFPTATFDAIICVRVLHHLTDPTQAIAEFHRTLKPRGWLILEVANKVHFKALVLGLIRGNLSDVSSQETIDRRSPASVRRKTISFVNHHPAKIKQLLKGNSFTITETLSVSNFRSDLANQTLLRPIFLVLEKLSQPVLGKVNFGPSLYLLAQRT